MNSDCPSLCLLVGAHRLLCPGGLGCHLILWHDGTRLPLAGQVILLYLGTLFQDFRLERGELKLMLRMHLLRGDEQSCGVLWLTACRLPVMCRAVADSLEFARGDLCR